MKQGIKDLLKNKDKTIPILSFPSTQLLGINVLELIGNSDNQARGMKAVADKCNISVSLNMMDLSVEAEAFGSAIKATEDEIPTVVGSILETVEDIENLQIPQIGAGRTGIYIDGVRKAKSIISDKPVYCGVIGPYSLAGRLFDMTELMMLCYDEPEAVAKLVEKCTEFIIKYIKAFKEAGADGVIMAEPAAGLLSPDLCEEFSSVFAKRIVGEVSDDNFIFVYHNCGNVIPLSDSIISIDADAYHFGNAIELAEIIPLFPKDKVIMGNVNPIFFKSSNPEDIKKQTVTILNKCNEYDNFLISSGCDIPADSKWENIEAYFDAVKEFYKI